jgi:hypothetical protein
MGGISADQGLIRVYDQTLLPWDVLLVGKELMAVEDIDGFWVEVGRGFGESEAVAHDAWARVEVVGLVTIPYRRG